jgi:hypothetical protein
MSNSIHAQLVNTIPGYQEGGEAAPQGGAAPLDLFNGHLRTIDGFDDNIPYNDLSFVPLVHNSKPYSAWLKYPDVKYEQFPFVAKVQPFAAGGYEATIRQVDLDKVGRAMDGGGASAQREKGEQKESDVVRSKQRAKTKMRHLIKSMGCDRLLTLNVREGDEDFWSVEVWAANWKKFVRLCAKAGCSISYVCVLERHKKGNYHLHAAIVGYANIKLMRHIWWAICGGHGQGNVDVSFKQNQTVHQRRAGVAKYVTKYLTKQDDVVDFNKKRYWQSKHKLPEAIRYVLSSSELHEALLEVAGIFNLDKNAILDSKSVFIFNSGAWFSFDEGLCSPVPF